MSATRMQKRHPRSPVEQLQVTRSEVINFSMFLRTDPDFCAAVMKTVETLRHNEAIVAEHKRREAWPRWRKWLHAQKRAVVESFKAGRAAGKA